MKCQGLRSRGGCMIHLHVAVQSVKFHQNRYVNNATLLVDMFHM